MRAWHSRFVVPLMILVAQPLRAYAAGLSSYSAGSIPVSGLLGDFEFPLDGDFKAQVSLVLLGQGTYDDGNPFAHLSVVSPSIWGHYDGISNLRLSLGLEETWLLSISELGRPSLREDRLIGRARLQQPRGASAIYEMLQLDLRSFDDAAGAHHWVFRPRLRVGTGFNLDATRVHSLVLFQEAALRFSDSGYTTRAFDFYRAVIGYTWTTKRGTFVTAGMLGQVSLNPAGTRFDILYGPILSIAYRIFAQAKPPEAPPEPPELETP